MKACLPDSQELNLQSYCLHKHGRVPIPIVIGTIVMKVKTKENEDLPERQEAIISLL